MTDLIYNGSKNFFGMETILNSGTSHFALHVWTHDKYAHLGSICLQHPQQKKRLSLRWTCGRKRGAWLQFHWAQFYVEGSWTTGKVVSEVMCRSHKTIRPKLCCQPYKTDIHTLGFVTGHSFATVMEIKCGTWERSRKNFSKKNYRSQTEWVTDLAHVIQHGLQGFIV